MSREREAVRGETEKYQENAPLVCSAYAVRDAESEYPWFRYAEDHPHVIGRNHKIS